MKTIRIVLILFIALGTSNANAQLLKKLGQKAQKAAEKTLEKRVEKESSENTDKVLDKVFSGGTTQSKDKQKNTDEKDPTQSVPVSTSTGGDSFETRSKYDFVPGEKIVAMEDFSQDAVGDFPDKWNTNASGEIMQIEDAEGHWLALTAKGASTPEFISNIPENTTIEFDLAVTPKYSYYSSPLFVSVISATAKNDFTAWSYQGAARKNYGVQFSLHPQAAGSGAVGRTLIQTFENKEKILENKNNNVGSFNIKTNKAHIALWRQKQRLRVYVNETKLWDLPRAFAKDVDYNTLIFGQDGNSKNEYYLISNIRLAIGEPDTRNKLVTEGKFSTTGIHFATGSADIMIESHGALKEIADVLKENPSMNVLIIGHTDNIGNAATNQRLSEQRAAAVKAYLNTQFEIPEARMDTTGKGDTQPVADNDTSEGRAQNRRVEFQKT